MSTLEHLKFLVRLKFGIELEAHQDPHSGHWYISGGTRSLYNVYGVFLDFTTEEEAWEYLLSRDNWLSNFNPDNE